jgi:uncharacterized protein YlxP (DUF503 family)
MHIGILQFELLIRGAESIKDKRRVVRSLKDRLHREHMVSIAEVGLLDHPRAARLGLACVSGDARHLASVLDAVTRKLRTFDDAELGELSRDIISDSALPGSDTADDGSPLWTPDEARDRT